MLYSKRPGAFILSVNCFRSPLGEVFCIWQMCRVWFSCGIRAQTRVPRSIGTGGCGQIPSSWWPSSSQWQQPWAKPLNHGWICENKPLGTETCVPQQAEFQLISPRHHQYSECGSNLQELQHLWSRKERIWDIFFLWRSTVCMHAPGACPARFSRDTFSVGRRGINAVWLNKWCLLRA